VQQHWTYVHQLKTDGIFSTYETEKLAEDKEWTLNQNKMLELKWQNLALMANGKLYERLKLILFYIADKHWTLDIFA